MIRTIYIILIFTLFPFYSYSFLSSYSNKERVVDSVLKKTSLLLENKYDIKTIGTGGRMMNEINELSLAFSTCKPLTIECSRIIIVDCIRQLVHDINSDVNIRPYLIHYPFNESDVDVTIYFNGVEDEDLSKLSYVAFYCGRINYCKLDPNKLGKELVDKTETFEEALSTVNSKI